MGIIITVVIINDIIIAVVIPTGISSFLLL